MQKLLIFHQVTAIHYTWLICLPSVKTKAAEIFTFPEPTEQETGGKKKQNTVRVEAREEKSAK